MTEHTIDGVPYGTLGSPGKITPLTDDHNNPDQQHRIRKVLKMWEEEMIKLNKYERHRTDSESLPRAMLSVNVTFKDKSFLNINGVFIKNELGIYNSVIVITKDKKNYRFENFITYLKYEHIDTETPWDLDNDDVKNEIYYNWFVGVKKDKSGRNEKIYKIKSFENDSNANADLYKFTLDSDDELQDIFQEDKYIITFYIANITSNKDKRTFKEYFDSIEDAKNIIKEYVEEKEEKEKTFTKELAFTGDAIILDFYGRSDFNVITDYSYFKDKVEIFKPKINKIEISDKIFTLKKYYRRDGDDSFVKKRGYEYVSNENFNEYIEIDIFIII